MRPQRDAPIFIGGLSHSGKTPLRMVLGAHPDLVMTRRTKLWDRFYGRFGDLGDRRNLERCVAAIVAHPGADPLEPDPERLLADLSDGPVTYARLFGLVHRHHADGLDKRRWGEQLGFVERFAAPIFASFPDARMIHMVRDPRHRQDAAAAHSRGRRGKVGWETATWLHSAELAERNRTHYPHRYRVVRYETLVASPTETVEELCAFIGEDFSLEMATVLASIRWHDATSTSRHPDIGTRVPSGRTRFIDRYARRELEAFDYAVSDSELSGRELLSYLVGDWPVNRTTLAARRLAMSRSSTNRIRR